MNNKEKQRNKIIFYARKNLGRPYKYGAKLYEAPNFFDCSSFIHYLYERININLPRTALEQAHLGRAINPKKEDLMIGDLIFIKGKWGHYDQKFLQGIGHVAVYADKGKVIHAKMQAKNGRVRKDSVDSLLKRKDLVVIKRII
ncbi:C40 family peptidase [Patescibacteria group bacterium]|nr:C40 family peptidase [Patescibacteria group bacterium]MBU1674045.1 C40 family peptidase [Patescibacteria group bacterium]MBU1963193.1 C40 family peptidase [Patescibacteria group bacterium]